jgi:hypothetical protein
MAKKLDSFSFGEKYPWDEWLDGSPWQIEDGDVSGSNLRTFVGTARSQAAKRNMKLRSRSTSDGEAVIIQAYTE